MDDAAGSGGTGLWRNDIRRIKRREEKRAVERSDEDSAKRNEKAIDGDSAAMRMHRRTPYEGANGSHRECGKQLLAAMMVVEYGLFTAANTTENNRG